MEKEKVTCIILSYNNIEFIYEAINSVLLQDYMNIELIISDDGSTNFNVDEIKNYVNKNKGKNIEKLIVNKNIVNIGTVKNFNNAIKKSTGKYIFPLAADDKFVSKKVFSLLVDAFKKTKALVITCKSIYNSKTNFNNKIVQEYKNINAIKNLSKDQLFKMLSKENFISGSVTYFDKTLFEKYGNFNENYRIIEDWPNNLKLVRNNINIEFVDIVTIAYRLNGESTVNCKSKAYLSDYLNIILNEILPYQKKLNIFLVRYNLWKIEKLKLQINDQYKGLNILFSTLKYIDILVYKIIYKIKEKYIYGKS